MQIKSLYIHNYKSFYDTTIEFDKFNIIVAPNNAGKSNLIDVLEFINIALEYDIERAIKEKGGIDNIKNYKNDEEKIIIKVCYGLSNQYYFNFGLEELNLNDFHNLSNGEINLKFTITENFHQIKYFSNLVIKSIEDVEFKKNIKTFEELILNIQNTLNKKRNFKFKFAFYKNYYFNKSTKNFIIKGNKFFKVKNKRLSNYKSIIVNNLGLNFENNILKNFNKYTFNLSSYYFNPEIIKQKSDIEVEKKLRKNGSNLGKSLAFIKEYDENKFEKISNSLIGIVEEIDSLNIIKVADKHIIVFKEKNKDISTDRISDGTINFLSTITALNQPEDGSFMLAFEEPERHLHLKAVNYLLDEFRNHEKQILITTHSTEILNSAKIEELIFMYRDSYGETQAIRADKIKDLKGKLKRLGYKKDLSISELIDENILGDLDGYQ